MKYVCMSILRVIIEFITGFYILNKFLNKEERKSKRLYIIVVILIVILLIILGAFNDFNKDLIKHLILFVMCMMIFNNRKKEVIIPVGVVNIICEVVYIFLDSFFYMGAYELKYKLIEFSIGYVITFFLVKYSYVVVQICNVINKYKRGSEIVVLINIIIDLFVKYYNIYFKQDNLFFMSMLIMSYVMFFFGGFIYIVNASNTANTVLELTKKLYIKNNELKKIKEEYEKQIYYFNYLTSVKRFDEAGEELENIIKQRQKGNVDYGKELKYKNDIVYLIINEVGCEGVKVIVKEECDLSKVVIPSIELYRVMFNIVNNALKAMNNQGIIILTMYEELDYAIITIENDGPKIECENINDIFKAGYTTKKNDDKSHGFGLSIVKDLVESYGGMISVRSDDMSTEFEISVPLMSCEENKSEKVIRA